MSHSTRVGRPRARRGRFASWGILLVAGWLSLFCVWLIMASHRERKALEHAATQISAASSVQCCLGSLTGAFPWDPQSQEGWSGHLELCRLAVDHLAELGAARFEVRQSVERLRSVLEELGAQQPGAAGQDAEQARRTVRARAAEGAGAASGLVELLRTGASTTSATLARRWNMLHGAVFASCVLAAVASGSTWLQQRQLTQRQFLEQELQVHSAQLREQNQALERSNRELEAFAGVIAHDLKAPLRGIGLLADWVIQDHPGQLDLQAREKLVLLQQRVRRMNDLIDGLLEYSRSGQGRDPVETVDVQGLVRGILAARPEQPVGVDVDQGLPEVRCQATALREVMQHLVHNALGRAPRVGGRVHIFGREQPDAWVISVSDNGPRIEERQAQRIFEIFRPTGGSEDEQRRSVGLPIVKKIVEGHGGRVWVESEPGRGSTFSFTICKH